MDVVVANIASGDYCDECGVIISNDDDDDIDDANNSIVIVVVVNCCYCGIKMMVVVFVSNDADNCDENDNYFNEVDFDNDNDDDSSIDK